MGSYYTLGVVTKFEVQSKIPLSIEEWRALLDSRLDTSLFTLEVKEKKNVLIGELYPEIFQENIHGLYGILRNLIKPLSTIQLDDYEQVFGDDISNYQIRGSRLSIEGPDGEPLIVNISFAMLFIEGKVLVEEFYSEPQIINWLFRNCNIDNKLAGCIVSEIV
ncbi:MAG: hypothetical protein LRY73_11460 [Bacillus sp. (in: Bacteria)]|nr:hypothetical protein [Bacillus sp. (in: firmicutes)]